MLVNFKKETREIALFQIRHFHLPKKISELHQTKKIREIAIL